jgi:hypothetical protein
MVGLFAFHPTGKMNVFKLSLIAFVMAAPCLSGCGSDHEERTNDELPITKLAKRVYSIKEVDTLFKKTSLFRSANAKPVYDTALSPDKNTFSALRNLSGKVMTLISIQSIGNINTSASASHRFILGDDNHKQEFDTYGNDFSGNRNFFTYSDRITIEIRLTDVEDEQIIGKNTFEFSPSYGTGYIEVRVGVDEFGAKFINNQNDKGIYIGFHFSTVYLDQFGFGNVLLENNRSDNMNLLSGVLDDQHPISQYIFTDSLKLHGAVVFSDKKENLITTIFSLGMLGESIGVYSPKLPIYVATIKNGVAINMIRTDDASIKYFVKLWEEQQTLEDFIESIDADSQLQEIYSKEELKSMLSWVKGQFTNFN